MTDAHDDLPVLPKVEKVALLCIVCSRPLPDEAFKDRNGHAIYTGRCNVCAKNMSNAAKGKKKAEVEADKVMKVVKKINAAHISEIVEAIMHEYEDRDGGGSIRNFAKSFKTVGDAIMADDPGSKKALDYHMGIAKLIIASTVNRESAPDVEHLSDADLEREARQLLTIHIPKEGQDVA